jgi:regulator of protease activity HflC (stomatin/prohibitin superfamily)
VEQYQHGVVFRFGKLLPEILGPGLHFIVPIADKMVKVTM